MAESETPKRQKDGSHAASRGEGEVSIELLHARFQHRLKGYFFKRLGASPDVDDLVQETFTRIARPHQLDAVEDAEAYLFQVAANLILERGRRGKVRAIDAHIELDPELEDARVFSPERILASKQELNAVLQALQELPERTRIIFALQRFEGLTYAEIAKKLGVTESAIDKQMGKALEHLTRRLEQLT